ncbi:MAG: tRNA uridine-5-carboxymethylaminomethyl(34) synthesis GTPase MnmE [Pseudohongiellaceae bacterium]
MSTTTTDTICAIATAPGRGGVGIVRVSGPLAASVCRAILGEVPPPRTAHFAEFRDGDGAVIDQGIALYFKAPRSFTGEDVLELQGHGGVQVMSALLGRVLALGARLANPGEFSERAFLNNKIDLAQAEAIADLIDAGSAQAMRSAMRTLQGEFSRLIHALVAELTQLRVHVEAAIDFSDEDIDVMSDTGVADRLTAARQRLVLLFARAEQGTLLKEGINIVIAGKPNAGKSSLLNALSGQDTAIVTDIAGTTRDLLRTEISLDGLPLHITDTAGLRLSDDIVEQEGVRRARQAMGEADQILLLVDASTGKTDVATMLEPLALNELPAESRRELLARTTLVLNKIDLLSQPDPGISSTDYAELTLSLVRLSATQGTGLPLLAAHLKDLVGYRQSGEGVFVARQRHLQALTAAAEHLDSAAEGVSDHLQLELIAEELRLAQRQLGLITGTVTSDDLLGEIFSSFCVGK